MANTDYLQDTIVELSGPGGVRKWTLPVTITRRSQSDDGASCIDSATYACATVSRTHARLYCSNNEAYISDCNSTHGTYVNGVRVVQPTKIFPGDVLKLGTRLRNDRQTYEPVEHIIEAVRYPGSVNKRRFRVPDEDDDIGSVIACSEADVPAPKRLRFDETADVIPSSSEESEDNNGEFAQADQHEINSFENDDDAYSPEGSATNVIQDLGHADIPYSLLDGISDDDLAELRDHKDEEEDIGMESDESQIPDQASSDGSSSSSEDDGSSLLNEGIQIVQDSVDLLQEQQLGFSPSASVSSTSFEDDINSPATSVDSHEDIESSGIKPGLVVTSMPVTQDHSSRKWITIAGLTGAVIGSLGTLTALIATAPIE
ncbi:hypothetical protein CANCADRAFT_490 [Tortispora caseinolytica NRRL Y-17796]|uniref:FHA domain-containing protein n=1 Tax=Tortispora caseinolytica NRRL Y-17796 TaxID=767744 RepID=A0A1E4TJH5_9ASCO|nr:hypothetical protein CANCADRAFT_490 [Tortispora caseinolytica NRRL Y-17796]